MTGHAPRSGRARRSGSGRTALPLPRRPWPVPGSTGWARTPAVSSLRQLLHRAVIRPLLAAELRLDVGGLEEVAELSGPVVLVANHASHLDAPLVLDALPDHRRGRTAVAVTGDWLLDSGLRAAGSALVFNTVAGTDRSGRPARLPGDLLARGWSVLMFGESSRSGDGFVGAFAEDAARLALEHRVPVVPVGIRGSFAAMPRGTSWPGPRRSGRLSGLGLGSLGLNSLERRTERPRVSVRFGSALHAGGGLRPGEGSITDSSAATEFTGRIRSAVKQLIAEDVTTWWQSQRDPYGAADREPPVGSWRRIWQQNLPTDAGGGPSRPKIWR